MSSAPPPPTNATDLAIQARLKTYSAPTMAVNCMDCWVARGSGHQPAKKAPCVRCNGTGVAHIPLTEPKK